MNKFNNVLSLSLVAVFAANSAIASPIFRMDQSFAGFNDNNPDPFVNFYDRGEIVSPIAQGSSDGSTVSSTLNGTYQTSGLTFFNDNSTMTVSYDASAEVSAAGLRASASLSIDDSIFNPNNTPFVDANSNINLNGVPEALLLESIATYSDDLTVVGGIGLHSISLSLFLDGSLDSGPGKKATPSVAVRQGFFSGPRLFSENANRFDADSFFNIDEMFQTNAMEVVNGEASLALQLETSVDVDLSSQFSGAAFGGPLAGTSDFFNTLHFGEISGFDAFGNPVDLVSAVSSSGFQFETVRVDDTDPSEVPEPSTLALIALGGLLASSRRKRVV